MYKKSLFLFFLLCSAQVKPLVFETLAVIGAVAVARNRTVQIVSKFALQKFQCALQARGYQIGAPATLETPKLGVMASQVAANMRSKMADVVAGTQAFAVVGRDRMAAALVAFQARAQAISLKQPWIQSVQQTTTSSSSATHVNMGQGFGSSVGGTAASGATSAGATFSAAAGESAGATGLGAASQSVAFETNTTSNMQKVVGLWPRITNIYHTGDSKALLLEMGKRKFWQGVACGGIGTAWLLKKPDTKQEPKEDQEVKKEPKII